MTTKFIPALSICKIPFSSAEGPPDIIYLHRRISSNPAEYLQIHLSNCGQ